MNVHACIYTCVCVSDREKDRDKETDTGRKDSL